MIEACRYRGYEIVPHQQWSNWCVSVHPTRPDLPILSHPTLQILSAGKEEAIAAARRDIDRILLMLG